jgi:hypothetical protein
MRIPCLLFIALLCGCAPKPSGIYSGYLDVGGDRVKVTMDFRVNGQVLRHCQKESSSVPERTPMDDLQSILEGDEHGIRITLVGTLVRNGNFDNGRWISRGRGIDVFEDPLTKKKLMTMSIEPDGDLTSDLLRLSKRSGPSPVVFLDTKKLHEEAKRAKKPQKE